MTPAAQISWRSSGGSSVTSASDTFPSRAARITPAGSGANIRFYGDQDYTGTTTIFRVADAGSMIELTAIAAYMKELQ